jgi:hypothetical protein
VGNGQGQVQTECPVPGGNEQGQQVRVKCVKPGPRSSEQPVTTKRSDSVEEEEDQSVPVACPVPGEKGQEQQVQTECSVPGEKGPVQSGQTGLHNQGPMGNNGGGSGNDNGEDGGNDPEGSRFRSRIPVLAANFTLTNVGIFGTVKQGDGRIACADPSSEHQKFFKIATDLDSGDSHSFTDKTVVKKLPELAIDIDVSKSEDRHGSGRNCVVRSLTTLDCVKSHKVLFRQGEQKPTPAHPSGGLWSKQKLEDRFKKVTTGSKYNIVGITDHFFEKYMDRMINPEYMVLVLESERYTDIEKSKSGLPRIIHLLGNYVVIFNPVEKCLVTAYKADKKQKAEIEKRIPDRKNLDKQ